MTHQQHTRQHRLLDKAAASRSLKQQQQQEQQQEGRQLPRHSSHQAQQQPSRYFALCNQQIP